MRVVFDTNVVISALIFGRRLAWLRNGWVNGGFTPIVCRETADELLRVLAYPKFRLCAAERAALLEDYLPYAEVVSLPDPRAQLPIACRDRDDAMFLHLAMTAAAPLVSGDADLAQLRGVALVEIMSIAELWASPP